MFYLLKFAPNLESQYDQNLISINGQDKSACQIYGHSPYAFSGSWSRATNLSCFKCEKQQVWKRMSVISWNVTQKICLLCSLFLNIGYNSNIAIVRQVRTYMEQLSEQLMHTELERNFVPHMSYNKRLVHSHISVGHLLAVAGLGPVLLQRSVVVASLLANGSAAFSWKLRCHGLRVLLLHHITHVIQVTGMGNRLILLKASRMVYCIKS